MTQPKRIQLSRKKGYRKPAGAVVVTRPGKWGNPWKVGDPYPGYWSFTPIADAEEAVAIFRKYALGRLAVEPDWLEPLRGKTLACWCALDKPCHADILLDLANRPCATKPETP